MKSMNNPMNIKLSDTLSDDNYHKIIDKWSNLTFYDNNLNRYSLNLSPDKLQDMYHFTILAEQLLRDHQKEHSHTMVAFHIQKPALHSRIYDINSGEGLAKHTEAALKSHIKNPNLSCGINEDTFIFLLEDYKTVDTALLVINLTEEISRYYPDLKLRLTFGSCRADPYEYEIPCLCRRAFYAMSTISGDDQQLMADYNDIILEKKLYETDISLF